MDLLEQMRIELPGIQKNINRWSRRCTASTLFPKLLEAIDKSNKESAIYCLAEIIKSYNKEIKDMNDYPVGVDIEENIRSLDLLKKFFDGIQSYNLPLKEEICENPNELQTQENPIIFLSHKSSDKKYGDILRDFIVGVGVKDNQLIYTSHPLHKIPLDTNIYDYLRKNISRKIFMIILWSNDYLESPACLNEMGATWVVQCDYTNIYTPDFDFGNPKYHECAVDTRKMGAVLNGNENCKQNMLELKNKIVDMFELEVNESRTTYLLDEMMKKLQGAN